MTSLEQPIGTPRAAQHVETLFKNFLAFIHPDDLRWLFEHDDEYTQRLAFVLEDCDRVGTLDPGFHRLLQQNAAYIYEFLPIYDSPTGKSAARQATALLLTQAEYHWLIHSADARAANLRHQAMNYMVPDIHERSQWELAESIDEARQQGAFSALQQPGNAVASAAMPERGAHVIHAEHAYCLALWRNVMILDWRTAPTAQSLRSIRTGVKKLVAMQGQAGGGALIVRIAQGASVPDAETRRANAELLADYKGYITAKAVIIEDTGAMSAVKRGIVTALQAVFKSAEKTRFFADTPAAVDWVCALLQHEPSELQEAIREARAALDAAEGRS